MSGDERARERLDRIDCAVCRAYERDRLTVDHERRAAEIVAAVELTQQERRDRAKRRARDAAVFAILQELREANSLWLSRYRRARLIDEAIDKLIEGPR